MGLLNSLGGGRRGGGMSPVMMGLMGLLAYKTLKGKGRLTDMLGSGGEAEGRAGALPGGAVGSGLRDLLDRFTQGGQQEKAQSWVSSGPNKPIAPQELEQVLGEERIQWLVEQTNMPRDELLTSLSGELPDAVDKLTPNGRIPTDEELSRQE